MREAGFDVQAVADRDDPVACGDRVVFETAAAEGRAVATSNIKELPPLAAEWFAHGRTHPGLILLPSARMRTRAVRAVAAALHTVLSATPEDIAGSEQWIVAAPIG